MTATPVLTVSGNLEGIKVRLGRIKEIITRRNSEGYSMFKKEFIYKYSTMHDGRECHICLSHDGVEYNGEEVEAKFPMVIHLSGNEYHPRTHDAPDFPKYIKDRDNDPNNKCGCRLYLINKAIGFEQALHREKLDAM